MGITSLFLLNHHPGHSGTYARWYWYARWMQETGHYSTAIVLSCAMPSLESFPEELSGKVYYENALLMSVHHREYDIVEKLIEILLIHSPEMIEVWYGHPYLKYLALLPKKLTGNVGVIVRHAGSDLHYHLSKFPSFLKSVMSTIEGKFGSLAIHTDEASQPVWMGITPHLKIVIEPYRPLFWSHLLQNMVGEDPSLESLYGTVYFGKWKQQLLAYVRASDLNAAVADAELPSAFFLYDLPDGLRKQLSVGVAIHPPVHPCSIPLLIQQSRNLLVVEDSTILAPNHQSSVYREALFMGKTFLSPSPVLHSVVTRCDVASSFVPGWRVYNPVHHKVDEFRRREKECEELYSNFISKALVASNT